MIPILGEWREGKVRPLQGNAPHDRPVSREIVSLKNICDDPFGATRFPQLHNCRGPRQAFLRHGGIYRSDVVLKTTPQPEPAASRHQVPIPGSRTRREDHIHLIVRDEFRPAIPCRVGRHQSPTLLHRHTQTNTHFSKPAAKEDISTLPGGGHFYFALTRGFARLKLQPLYRYYRCDTVAHPLLVKRARPSICGMIFQRCELCALLAPPVFRRANQECTDPLTLKMSQDRDFRNVAVRHFPMHRVGRLFQTGVYESYNFACSFGDNSYRGFSNMRSVALPFPIMAHYRLNRGDGIALRIKAGMVICAFKKDPNDCVSISRLSWTEDNCGPATGFVV